MASNRRMILVGHSCVETSDVVGESGIHRWSLMNLVKYARVGVSQMSSLVGSWHWSIRTTESDMTTRHNIMSFGQSRLMVIALRSI